MADRVMILILGAAAAGFHFMCSYFIIRHPLWLALVFPTIWVYVAVSLYRHCECGQKKKPYQ